MKSPAGDGATQGAHLRQAQESAKALGLEWAALEEIEADPDPSVMLPEGFDFIWGVFGELNVGRGSGFAPNPIAWADILAWSVLYSIRLDPWELDALRLLDAVWLKAMSEGRKANETEG